MKKKHSTTKSKVKSKKQQIKKPKQIIKKKIKSTNDKIQDYIIINGMVYHATTNTQRYNYQKYINTIQIENKSNKSIKISKKQNNINLQEYVRSLSKQQKINIFKKLEQQIKPKQQKINIFKRLQNKLQQIKLQLNFKWEHQNQKIIKLYYNGTISENQKSQKLNLIKKLKQYKIEVIQCTQNLFKKMLTQPKQNYSHQSNLQDIIHSLNSFSSLQHFSYSDFENKSYPKQRQIDSQTEDITVACKNVENFQQFQQLSNKQQKKTQQSSEFNQLQNLKKLQELAKIPQLFLEKQNQIPEETYLDSKKDDFICQEPIQKKIKIPILMTKDKIQQLQTEKKIKENQIFKEQIERKIAIQLSCLEEQNQNLFTTLADINNYIVNFYEYLSNVCISQIVSNLNIPYGKSVLDKLYLLQTFGGSTSQEDINNVLLEEYYQQHQKQIALTVRRVSDYEKIHNRAVFDCFNIGLNAYRPYYQIDGQVYPWIVSEKGITFYQINQQNVQQVFQKTKIKVLEYCSNLCGLMNKYDENLSKQKLILLTNKREQLQIKCMKNQINQQYKQWDLKVISFDTLCRLIISENIFHDQLMTVTKLLQLHL